MSKVGEKVLRGAEEALRYTQCYHKEGVKKTVVHVPTCESLHMTHEVFTLVNTYDDLQKRHINQLNNAIEEGLRQLDAGEKIVSEELYKCLCKKIKTAAKDK